MLDQIGLLIKLQAVDKTVFDLDKELREIPERLSAFSVEEEHNKADLDKLSAELDALRKQRKNLENENDNIRARLRKAEAKLMNSKNQKEHRAATAELDDGRDILRANDDQLLVIMERQEPLEIKVKELSNQVERQSQVLAETRAQLKQRAEEASEILNQLKQSRGDVEKQVNKALLREYDFIRNRRQGVAISPVSKGNCGICHMQISPQQFNELLRAQTLMHCPSCKRIIYWADAENLHA